MNARDQAAQEFAMTMHRLLQTVANTGCTPHGLVSLVVVCAMKVVFDLEGTDGVSKQEMIDGITQMIDREYDRCAALYRQAHETARAMGSHKGRPS